MATPLVIKAPVFKIGDTALSAHDGTDLSEYIFQLVVNATIEEPDGTSFGAPARKAAPAGLEDNTLTISIRHDTTMSALDGVLWPLRGTESFFSVQFKPGSIDVDNPRYAGKVLVAGSYPIGGSVGDVMNMDLTWRIQTIVTRTTA